MTSNALDLVDLMRAAADRLEVEHVRAEKLRLAMENDQLRQQVETMQKQMTDWELKMRNVWSLLGRIPRVNGTVAEDVRTHRTILEETLPKRRMSA